MDVGNCFQLHASLVFIAVITFTSNVQRHPLKFLITLSISSTYANVFFFDKGHFLVIASKCAKLSSSYKFNQQAKLGIHSHPLTFIESPMAIDVLKRLNCCWCHEPLIDAIYFCVDCPSFIIHKKCLDELPTKINHPSHHIHPLFLNRSDDRFCKLCQKEHFGAFYGCSLCHFNISLECALLRSIVEDKSRHQHPFTLFWKQDSFICDACGTEGNYSSYICSTCCITIHKECTSLPHIIKFSRHDHCIFHKYFLETQELTKQDCKICFKEVKLDRGSYSCGKPGCNYVAHVNCVLENKDLYKVIEEEKQCEELDEKSMQSPIIRVIENARFFFIKPVLNCQESSNIGFIKAMPPSISTDSNIVAFVVDIVVVSSTILKGEKYCNGCGKRCQLGAFRCGKCKIVLDFGCLTVPHLAVHKIDEHMLNLTYMMIRSNLIAIFVNKKEIQAFGIILVQSVILLLISNVFSKNFHF
ncbi:hypothetical protein PVK06_021523 [Gossypium arboreum]|uniref:DC1 domain-containing protein n=1 Tax=Gossypium arboreum TaxID=29729 RepID=A0ABR0PQ79_GOSAR|nr:hypothetical protein PVK06_021523 [Gossypium arboreum]